MSNNPSTPGMTVFSTVDKSPTSEEPSPPKNVVVHSARNVKVYQPAGAGPGGGRYGGA